MMKYRNKRTGVVIDVSSVISGAEWEGIKGSGGGEKSSPPGKRTTTRKTKGKQNG